MSSGYLNSWVDFGAPLYAGAYLKDFNGLVHLRGTIKNGANGLPIFMLPTGSRPNAVLNFPVDANAAFGNIQIKPDGSITLTVGSNAAVDLNGIYFDAGDTTFYAATATAHRSVSQSIPSALFTVVNFDTIDTDTHASITPGTGWHFTCPTDGTYRISGSLGFTSTGSGNDVVVSVFKNNVEFQRGTRLQPGTGVAVNLPFSADVPCTAYDLLDVRMYSGSASSQTLNTNAFENRVSITKVVGIAAPYYGYSNPALYCQNNIAQSIPNATMTIVAFGVVVRDTDAAYNSGTGRWTCPSNKGGDYDITAQIAYQNAISGLPQLAIYKNGVPQITTQLSNIPAQITMLTKGILTLIPGDVIDIRTIQYSGSAQPLNTAIQFNYLQIKKYSDIGIPPPITLQRAIARSVAGQTLSPSGSFIPINYETVDLDTGGTVNPGSNWFFQCISSGLYLVTANVDGVCSSDEVDVAFALFDLGTNSELGLGSRFDQPHNGWPESHVYAHSLYLSVGQAIQMRLYFSTGSYWAMENSTDQRNRIEIIQLALT
jgi:hypothetical protein